MKKKSIILESEVLFINYSILALTAILSQFYKVRGFGDFEIGLLNSALPVMALVTNMLWFRIIKVFSVGKLISLLCIFSFISMWGVYLSRNFIPELILLILKQIIHDVNKI